LSIYPQDGQVIEVPQGLTSMMFKLLSYALYSRLDIIFLYGSVSDLLPALKGEGSLWSGEVWGYIPSESWVQPRAWSQARYPYPA